MYEVKIYKCISDPVLKQHWIYLQQGMDMSAFQFYNWNEMLEKEFYCNRMKSLAGRLLYIEILRNGKPIIIAPLHVQKKTIKFGQRGYEKGVYFLGMKGYSDYLNFVYRTIDVSDINYLFDTIKRETGQTYFFAFQVLENSKLCKLLFDKELKYSIQNYGGEACVELFFPGELAEFENRIKKNLKSNLKKQRNRYKSDNFCIESVLLRGKCMDVEITKRIAEIHEERFCVKNNIKKIAIKKGVKRFDEVQYSVANNENTWLLLGKYKSNIISYFFGLEDHNAIRIMQLGFDKKYTKYMPGNITFLKYVCDHYSDFSGRTVDFTRGEERYKYEFGGSRHEIRNFKLELK